MIGHLFKMVWNRKRANTLVAVEIAISFLVLFAVVSLAVYSYDNYRQPLGFVWQDVLNVRIDRNASSEDVLVEESNARTTRLLRALRELREVESAAAVTSTPYAFGADTHAHHNNGRLIRYEVTQVTDDFKDVMRLSLVKGRWFSREDNGTTDRPVVVNERLARTVFGSQDPVGKVLVEASDDRPRERVVGVVTDFRRGGEMFAPDNFAIYRSDLENPKTRPPRNLVVRLRPGTPRAFEETLSRRLASEEPKDSFTITPLSEMRETMLLVGKAPVIGAALVAGFLMIMVGLGLTGVLWQNVTQRTREIGLRRAKGATARDIHLQVLGELFVIATFGIVIGGAIAFQFPLLGLLGPVKGGVYAVSLAVSVVALYALTALCGLYPSRLATRVRPAEALHYE